MNQELQRQNTKLAHRKLVSRAIKPAVAGLLTAGAEKTTFPCNNKGNSCVQYRKRTFSRFTTLRTANNRAHTHQSGLMECFEWAGELFLASHEPV